MKQLFRLPLFGLAITLALLNPLGGLTRLKAQSLTLEASSTSYNQQPLSSKGSSKQNRPKKGRLGTGEGQIGKATPNIRRGQIGKSDCPTAQLPLTALVPEAMDGAQTISKHPTFWFYVPYTRANQFSAEFVLQDSEGNSVYRTPVRLPEVPSVVAVQIPATEAALETNKPYRWRFQINCSSPALKVMGWIQRGEVDPSFMQQIQAALPLQRAALYAEKGLWYNALSAIGEKRRANPQDRVPMEAWVSLLSQLELKDVASEPISQ